MSVFKYEILNPIIDKQKPFLDRRGFFVIPNLKTNYRYYLECANYNQKLGYKEYFILFSKEKFDNNCRLCNMDNYGRIKLSIKGELKDYIKNINTNKANINIEYVESESDYDVFKIE